MRLALALAVLCLAGCSALGIGKSLDATATLANEANVQSLVRENTAYTAADATLPGSVKTTRESRNAEAIKLAANLVEASK